MGSGELDLKSDLGCGWKVLTVVALFGWINSILDLSQTGVILGLGGLTHF